jgi:hypothetical protein
MELSTIKNYLKNTDQINTLRDEIKDYKKIESFVDKKNEIEKRRELLLLSIEEAREREKQDMRKKENDVDSRIEQIEQ